MALLTQPAFGPRAALSYITIGALLDVWTAVWYFAFGQGPLSNITWFWLIGLFMTGLTFVTIGVLLGTIGRSARKAELPPAEAVNAEVQIQKVAAQSTQPVATPAAGVAPSVVVRNAAIPNQAIPAGR